MMRPGFLEGVGKHQGTACQDHYHASAANSDTDAGLQGYEKHSNSTSIIEVASCQVSTMRGGPMEYLGL